MWNRICTFRNTLIQNTLICWNINLWQISYAINTVCLQYLQHRIRLQRRKVMTFSSVKVDMLILYSFCFYIACKTAKKKRMIKFVWSEWTTCIIRYRTIFMYAADAPPPLLHWVSSPKIFNLKNHEQCFSIFNFFKSKKWTIYTLYELIMTHCQIDLK